MQSRIDELIAARDDIRNLLDATDIATIFLDTDLHVRRYTPQATNLSHLTGACIGWPIEHFATTLKDLRLVEIAEKVLADLGLYESEVIDESNHRYRMRVRPYLFGADSPEEILGKPVLERVHQDFHAIFRKQVRTLIEQKKQVLAFEEK